jgi:hypothetical protein
MVLLFGIVPMIVKPVGGEITHFNVSGLLLVLPINDIALLGIFLSTNSLTLPETGMIPLMFIDRTPSIQAIDI